MARKTSSSGKQSNGVAGEEVGEGDERSLTLATSDIVDLKVDGVRLDKPQGRAQNGKQFGCSDLLNLVLMCQSQERLPISEPTQTSHLAAQCVSATSKNGREHLTLRWTCHSAAVWMAGTSSLPISR